MPDLYRTADLPAEIMASRLDGETLTLEVCLPGQLAAHEIVYVGNDVGEVFWARSASAAHEDWAVDNDDVLATEWLRLRREARRG